MNANLTYTMESLFGPCSELVDISVFLNVSSASNQDTLSSDSESVPPDVIEECRFLSHLCVCIALVVTTGLSVADIRHSLEIIWDNPTLSGHLIREHDRTVTALYSLNQRLSKSHRKPNFPDPDTLVPEVAEVQKNMEATSLDSLKCACFIGVVCLKLICCPD